MKLTMEIQGHNSGQSPKRGSGEMLTWASIWGSDTNNRHAFTKFYGEVAEAVNKKLASLLDKDEVVSSKRFVISLEGEWKTDEYQKDGKPQKQRFFHATTFAVLDGPALESARLRRDAVSSLKKAEDFRKNGQLALAYEAAAQFVANFAGVPLDLEQFLEASAADEAEFGAVARTEHNPEAAAAAHFERADTVAGITPPDVAAEAPGEPEAHLDQVDESQPMDFGQDGGDQPMDFSPDNDPELGSVGDVDDMREEDAINLSSPSEPNEVDVLDDQPSHQEQKPQPSFAVRGATPAFSAQRFSPADRPVTASKPFGRPEMVREAPQPSARIAEEVQHRSAPSSVPAFLRPK